MTAESPEGQHGDQVTMLLQQAAAGDGTAWVQIVERYGRRVFALAQSRCRNCDVAEEITQSVFVTVAEKVGAGDYTECGRFEQWLFRVAMNRVRDHVRRVKRRGSTGDEATLSAIASKERGESESDRAQELNLLRRALESLNDQDREVVELRHHGGLSFKQISDMLDEPLGTLLARHHRALRKLREAIDAMDVRADVLARFRSGIEAAVGGDASDGSRMGVV